MVEEVEKKKDDKEEKEARRKKWQTRVFWILGGIAAVVFLIWTVATNPNCEGLGCSKKRISLTGSKILVDVDSTTTAPAPVSTNSDSASVEVEFNKILADVDFQKRVFNDPNLMTKVAEIRKSGASAENLKKLQRLYHPDVGEFDSQSESAEIDTSVLRRLFQGKKVEPSEARVLAGVVISMMARLEALEGGKKPVAVATNQKTGGGDRSGENSNKNRTVVQSSNQESGTAIFVSSEKTIEVFEIAFSDGSVKTYRPSQKPLLRPGNYGIRVEDNSGSWSADDFCPLLGNKPHFLVSVSGIKMTSVVKWQNGNYYSPFRVTKNGVSLPTS